MVNPTFRTTIRSIRVKDGVQNFEARIGLGTDNQLSSTRYGYLPITRNRQELDMMYRGSWIVRQAVGVVADDMTRAGIEIHGTDDVEKLQNAMRRLGVWFNLSNAVRWGRLYGGALAVMMIQGQDMSTPLRPETIGPGQFKGLVVLDRWVLQPSTHLITEIGPNFGQPMSYRVVAFNQEGPQLSGVDIHYSRVMRFEGDDLPYYQRMYEMGWGMSIVEPFHDRLVAFDSTTMGMAQMVFKAHLRTMKIKNLRDNIAQGGKAYEGQIVWLDMVRRYQTMEGMTLMDAEDALETATYSFAGLPDVLIQMSQQVSGAVGIPIVKLFGMSPAGFSTGETDLRSYYDNIQLRQERTLRHPMELMLHVLHRSVLGVAPPAEFGFEFESLWGMTDQEKATTAASQAAVVVQVESAGIIKRSTALRELQVIGRDTGLFASVKDEDIEEAEQEEAEQPLPPPPVPGQAPDALPGAPAGAAPPQRQLPPPRAGTVVDPPRGAGDVDAYGGEDDDSPGPPPDFLKKPRLVAGAGMQMHGVGTPLIMHGIKS